MTQKTNSPIVPNFMHLDSADQLAERIEQWTIIQYSKINHENMNEFWAAHNINFYALTEELQKKWYDAQYIVSTRITERIIQDQLPRILNWSHQKNIRLTHSNIKSFLIANKIDFHHENEIYKRLKILNSNEITAYLSKPIKELIYEEPSLLKRTHIKMGEQLSVTDPQYKFAGMNPFVDKDSKVEPTDSQDCNKFAGMNPFIDDLKKTEPIDAQGWYLLGNFFVFDKEDYEQAIYAYEKALEYDPTNVDIWINLGNCYAEGKNDYLRGIHFFKKAIEFDKESEMAWKNLGMAFESIENYDQALDAYKKVLDISPDNAKVWFNVGEIYEKKGEIGLSIQAYEKCEIHDPNFDDAVKKLKELR